MSLNYEEMNTLDKLIDKYAKLAFEHARTVEETTILFRQFSDELANILGNDEDPYSEFFEELY